MPRPARFFRPITAGTGMRSTGAAASRATIRVQPDRLPVRAATAASRAARSAHRASCSGRGAAASRPAPCNPARTPADRRARSEDTTRAARASGVRWALALTARRSTAATATCRATRPASSSARLRPRARSPGRERVRTVRNASSGRAGAAATRSSSAPATRTGAPIAPPCRAKPA